MAGPGQSVPDYLQAASSITADGYICEVSIRHSEITPLDWSVGSIIGFHPCIDDTDIDNGDTEYQMSWTGLPAHDQSLGFGHMVLSAESPAAALPEGWQSQDIDTTGGSAAESDGTWAISADGADIWGSSDQFHYAYVPLSGDGTIIARVVSNGEGSNGWAKGGVMIRETLDADSKHAIMALTGGEGGGMAFQNRPETGSSSFSSHGDPPAAPPYWVKLTRVGNTITGYSSADGVDWVQQPDGTGGDMTTNPVDIEMAADVYIGLFVTSHASGEVRTYTFDNVSIELPKPPAKIHGAIVNRYSFTDGDTIAVDSISGRDGVLTGTAAISGNQLVLDGGGTVELPGDVLDPGLQSVTIEVWFELNAAQNWQRIFDFGETQNDAGGNTMFYTPTSGAGDSRFVISTNGVPSWQTGEDMVTSTAIEPNTPTHIACVYDGAVPEIRLYQDGSLVGSTPTTMSLSGVSRMFAYIGDAVYTPDPHLDGSIDEFRIYETALTDTALTDAEVMESFLAGPDAEAPSRPVHSYTFEDGTANDSVGSAHGTLVGDAAVVNGQLVLDGDGDWMDMPGDIIAMNTYEELTIEVMFTSVAGGNTGFHTLTVFGQDGTEENPGWGYKYLCLQPARGDNVSRGMIQTSSMGINPWEAETGVSDVVEHDDGLEHHMVCTVDDTELAFYVDGVLIGTAALAPDNSIAGISTDAARIGKGVYGVDPLWAGSVEELNIYNRALSLAEVQANYAAGPQKEGPAPVDPGTEGLMLHLPLDTASRGVTKDSSDNALDGTLFGEPIFVEGVDIMALQLDGVDDYVDCGNPSMLDFGTGDFTISAWINMTATERGTVYAKGGDNSGGVRYTFAMGEGNNDGKMTLTTDDDSTKVQAMGDTIVNDGTWHHVATMRSGTDLLVYVDGALDGTNTVPEGYDLSGTSQANALIGAITDARDATGATLEKFFAGIIDDVRIYNRALSAEEVLFLAGM
jgi:hypothetical protein